MSIDGLTTDTTVAHVSIPSDVPSDALHQAHRIDAGPLRRLCGGDVHLPGDPGYDAARMPWNVAVDQRPAAVVHPRSATDVSEVVRCAAGLGLRVAAQSTGHNAGPLAAHDLSDVVLVRMSGMNDVSVDHERGIVRVGSGAVWEGAVEAAAAAGGTVLHGSSPDVGIAGYTLGGGIGWYARKLGLAANSLTAIELVDARGVIIRTDAEHDPQLFWALRGGGGNFGVVTALEFRMYDFDTAYAGMMIWDVARRRGRAPHLGRVGGGRAGRGHHLVPDPAPPAAAGHPGVPARPHHRRHRRCRPRRRRRGRGDPRPAARRHARAGHLRPDADRGAEPAAHGPRGPDPRRQRRVDAVAPAGGGHPGLPRHGRRGRRRPRCSRRSCASSAAPSVGRTPAVGCCPSSTASSSLFGVAIAATPEMGAQGHADAQRLMAALAPWANGRNYLNFAEEPVDTRTAYPDASWIQLTGIRSAMDPDGLFVGNHPVPRLFEDGQRSY